MEREEVEWRMVWKPGWPSNEQCTQLHNTNKEEVLEEGNWLALRSKFRQYKAWLLCFKSCFYYLYGSVLLLVHVFAWANKWMNVFHIVCNIFLVSFDLQMKILVALFLNCFNSSGCLSSSHYSSWKRVSPHILQQWAADWSASQIKYSKLWGKRKDCTTLICIH